MRYRLWQNPQVVCCSWHLRVVDFIKYNKSLWLLQGFITYWILIIFSFPMSTPLVFWATEPMHKSPDKCSYCGNMSRIMGMIGLKNYHWHWFLDLMEHRWLVFPGIFIQACFTLKLVTSKLVPTTFLLI